MKLTSKLLYSERYKVSSIVISYKYDCVDINCIVVYIDREMEVGLVCIFQEVLVTSESKSGYWFYSNNTCIYFRFTFGCFLY